MLAPKSSPRMSYSVGPIFILNKKPKILYLVYYESIQKICCNLHLLVSSTMRIPPTAWLLVLLFCCMHLCSHVFVVCALCLDDQRSLLLKFKNTDLGGGFNHGKLGTWNESIDCCQWSGVTCDRDGHVIGLDLSGQLVDGKFNSLSSLFGLRHLESLNLAHNHFHEAEIPTELKKLENLIYLNLSNAGFVGQIPIEISQLKRLATLDISDTNWVPAFEDPNLKLEHPNLKLENPNLGKFVQNLSNIRQLYLDGVSVSAQGQEWTAALLQIPTLQELSMSYCDLSGPLQRSLATLENLSLINLGGNNFSSVVPESYASFGNLTTLGLYNCGLIGVFPQKIFQVPTLSFIDISLNFDLHGSFPDFPLNGSLRTLSVVATNFFGPLPNSISNLGHLSSLSLSASQFSGTLPNSFSNLTQLVEIDLSFNIFSGPIPSFARCQKLQHVDLSHNQFSGAIPSTHFEGLADLVEIYIYRNSFTGKIPTSIFMLPSLSRVMFSKNKFEGQLNVHMNVTDGIELLDLSHNHLEGSIPISLFQIDQLDTLDLSFNKFSGSLDLGMISKPGNLRVLYLSSNNLSKMDATRTPPFLPLFPNLDSVSLASCRLTAFPQFLKNQSLLSTLDLSDNHIAGTMPHWILKLESLKVLNISNNYLTNWEETLLSNMSYLAVLDLHSNHLCGPLPTLPTNLYYLDYSSNNLSSSIPPNIGSYLFETGFVDLSSNNLHGSIPESICNASSLEVLDLSNNSLTGTIPQCLIAMNGTLIILDLERNKLNGTIDTLPGSCGLRSLHLNGNSLQGKLPNYLVNCDMLEVLDLGDNQIEDQFPCWLKSILTLRVLILRSNKLHGSLRCQEDQVGWPHLQIFDVASNSFHASIPPSFFETWKAMRAGENYGLDHNPPFEFKTYHNNYYRDKVTVTSKEQKMKLVKILTIFTAVDLSNNKFEGSIPEDLGQLNALYILNLSHNAFSGHIPLSLGNLKDLESLDLSNNDLNGEIPTELASLSFLAFLNLSYNHLVGKIPTGTQIQSFEAASFNGNDGLCGPPLTPNCSGDGLQGTSPMASNSNKESYITWNFIAAELGFASAIGMIILLLVFHKGWRIWYWERVDNILYHIFPQLDFVIERRSGQSYRALRWKAY